MIYLGVLESQIFLEDMATVMHLPPPHQTSTHTPGYGGLVGGGRCVWFGEDVLRLPLQNFVQSGLRPLVPIEVILSKVIHLQFPLLPLCFKSSFGSMYCDIRDQGKRLQTLAFPF